MCASSKEIHTKSPEPASPCNPAQYLIPAGEPLGQRISPGHETNFSGVSIWQTQASRTWLPASVRSSRRDRYVENPIKRDTARPAPAHTARHRPLMPPHGPRLSPTEFLTSFWQFQCWKLWGAGLGEWKEEGLTCGFFKVWRGYPRNLRPWKPQNIEISMDFEGSEAGIVKNQRNLKVLGVLAGRRRDSLSRAQHSAMLVGLVMLQV